MADISHLFGGRPFTAPSADPEALTAALHYASMGWLVLPVVPGGKAPATAHGLYDATTDPATIRAWWESNPAYSVGIRAGQESGLVVFDIDPRNGGEDSWHQWRQEHGEPPDGPVQLTAGGGYHYLLQYTPDLKSCKLADGIDLLSDGRYFVAHPSQINGIGYEWEASSDPFEGVAAPPVPGDWIDAFRGRAREPTSVPDEIIKGDRNRALTSLAGHLRHIGLGQHEILASLRATNEARCEYPLPDSEVVRIAHWASRMEADQDVAGDTARGAASAAALLAPNPGRLGLEWADELGEYQPPDEIIESLIVARSLTVIYGDSNSGKTFFALSLATAIATGHDCYGRQTEPGLVVYLASESPGSVRNRLQAAAKHLSIDLSNLAIIPVPVNFYESDRDVKEVIELIKDVERARGMPVRVVFGDTLARISAGANENSGEDMGPVLARFELICRETLAAVVIIHHNGKDAAKGARGWSGIRAHIDTEIEVVEKDGIRSATITKQRELSSKGESIYFKLEIVEMGLTKWGKPATTCVAIPDDESQSEEPHKKRTKEESRLLDFKFTFRKAWFDSGCELRDDMPYISRSAFSEYLTKNAKKDDGSAISPRTIQNKLDKSRAGDLINTLINSNIAESYEHGWIICDAEFGSVLISIKDIL